MLSTASKVEGTGRGEPARESLGKATSEVQGIAKDIVTHVRSLCCIISNHNGYCDGQS